MVSEVVVMKRCGRCHEVKAVCLFSIDLTCKDGFKSQCKACKSQQDKARRAQRRASGLPSRTRGKRKPTPTSAWAVPAQTLAEGLDCVRLNNWRGPVCREPMRASL